MLSLERLFLATGGLVSGIMAGLLGIGGGVILVPLLVTLGYTPVQAVATSSLAIILTSFFGSVQNWRMGYFDFKRVLSLGLPALVTAQIGVYFAGIIAPHLLLCSFGILLLINIYLVDLRRRLTARGDATSSLQFNPTVARLVTGAAAGILAGLFGVGGGVIMVPLQILLLKEKIKTAIQTSLGVIVTTAISACLGHTLQGNVLFVEGIILGVGGLLGTQISTLLPRLPDSLVSLIFSSFLGVLSIYMFWQSWNSYQSI